MIILVNENYVITIMMLIINKDMKQDTNLYKDIKDKNKIIDKIFN